MVKSLEISMGKLDLEKAIQRKELISNNLEKIKILYIDFYYYN